MMTHSFGQQALRDEEASMSKKSSDANRKLVAALATTGAVFLARKVITLVWTRVTGKQPPTDPSDTSVTIPESLIWAAIAGITIEAARIFATRATIRRPVQEAETTKTT
jgi:hypothetical protein